MGVQPAALMNQCNSVGELGLARILEGIHEAEEQSARNPLTFCLAMAQSPALKPAIAAALAAGATSAVTQGNAPNAAAVINQTQAVRILGRAPGPAAPMPKLGPLPPVPTVTKPVPALVPAAPPITPPINIEPVAGPGFVPSMQYDYG